MIKRFKSQLDTSFWMTFQGSYQWQLHTSRIINGQLPSDRDWTVSPNILMLKLKCPVPQNVTLFEDRNFKAVIKLKMSLGCAQVQSDYCPYKKRKGRYTVTRDEFTQRKVHVNTQQEGDCLQARERSIRIPNILTPWSQTSWLQNCGPPSLQYFVLAGCM